MGDVVLAANGVRKEFFRKGAQSALHFDAVADATVQLAPGDVVACMGRSGSGKTTLLNIMAGLLEPTEGSVELEGRSLYSLGDRELSQLRNATIGVVPQGHTGVHSLTLVQNVMLPSVMYGTRTGDADQRAMDLLEDLGIARLAQSYPKELSGGELRRMAIARALANNPQVLLADEPTGDLDDASTADVLRVLQNAAKKGTAVFMVTHDPDAAACAGRIVRMSDGRLEAG